MFDDSIMHDSVAKTSGYICMYALSIIIYYSIHPELFYTYTNYKWLEAA